MSAEQRDDKVSKTVEVSVSAPLGIRQTMEVPSYLAHYGGYGATPIDVEECGWCYALVRADKMSSHMRGAGHL